MSATEAAKMLLGVLGYNAEKSGLVGNDWAINTNVLANQNGLYKNLSNLNANTLLTRDNAAQMIYNALDANMVELNRWQLHHQPVQLHRHRVRRDRHRARVGAHDQGEQLH